MKRQQLFHVFAQTLHGTRIFDSIVFRKLLAAKTLSNKAVPPHKDQFGAVIDAASPARLVPTRISTLASVESAEDGWRLVPSSIELESGAYE